MSRRVVLVCVLWLVPLAVAAGQQGTTAAATVAVQLLAFNDFHGTLEPRSGSNGVIASTEAGGVEYFAAALARLKATNPNTVIVSAGDNVGASPLLSSMFHDEPTIEALGLAELQVSAIGNHELDEGWAELYRLQKGGCHPVDGCQDGTPFTGAAFQYLGANIWLEPRFADPASLRRVGLTRGDKRRRLFPASMVRTIAGVKIGFIGLTLRGAPQVVSPAGIRGLTFEPEAQAANAAARALRRSGVGAIVVLIHEGGTPDGSDVNGCENLTGPIVDIARGMSDEIDVIVSGHTHEAYNCTIGTKLVTSAASYSRLITDIDLTVDRRTGRVTGKAARNVVVAREGEKAHAETSLIEHYHPFAEKLGSRVVGSIVEPVVREPNAAGESALGDAIADGMLEAARARVRGGAALAFWNPGGIRADLVGKPGRSGQARDVTYEEAFDVLPFGNQLVVRTMTGEELLRLLEQQFDNPSMGRRKILQVSAGFSYKYDDSRVAGQRIDRASVAIAGRPLVATDRYRIATSDFIWAGGDDFTVAKEALEPVGVGLDIDIFLAHLREHTPLSPGPQNRIQRGQN